jgi:hypothetical protein
MYLNKIADLQLLQHVTSEPLLVYFASPVRKVKLVRILQHLTERSIIGGVPDPCLGICVRMHQ